MRLEAVCFAKIFLVLSVLTCGASAQYSCRDFVETSQRNVSVNATFVGVIESVFISDLNDAEIEKSSYLEAYVDYYNYLSISVSKSFQDYEGDHYVVASLRLDCTDRNYTVDYHLNIETGPCDGITFNSHQYSFSFYDTLPRYMSLDLDDSNIVVEDCIGDSPQVTIEDNEYFEIKPVSPGKTKVHAILTLLQDVEPPFEGSFNLSAWDLANPEKIAVATVKVKVVDFGRMLFTKSVYHGTVAEDLKVVITDGPIALETDFDVGDLNVQVSSEYIDFFDVQFTFDEINLFIWPERAPKVLPEYPIVLNLTANCLYLEKTAEATVILDAAPRAAATAAEPEPTSTESPQDKAKSAVVESEEKAKVSDKGNRGNIVLSIPIAPGKSEEVPNDRLEGSDENDYREKIEKAFGDVNRWEFEDDIDDFIPNEDGPVRMRDPNLAAFDFWVVHTKAFIITVMVLSVVIILSAILYIRTKMAKRRYSYY